MMSTIDHNTPPTGEGPTSEPIDLLVGVKEIAAALGRAERQVDRLLREKKIPAFAYGRRAATTRAALARWVQDSAERARAEHEARIARRD